MSCLQVCEWVAVLADLKIADNKALGKRLFWAFLRSTSWIQILNSLCRFDSFGNLEYMSAGSLNARPN
jgi:hypothetical protein